jgi:hypothetical protein
MLMKERRFTGLLQGRLVRQVLAFLVKIVLSTGAAEAEGVSKRFNT